MECKEDDERKEMKKLLRQQAAIIEAFRRQARNSVARNPLIKIKFKRRRKSVRTLQDNLT